MARVRSHTIEAIEAGAIGWPPKTDEERQQEHFERYGEWLPVDELPPRGIGQGATEVGACFGLFALAALPIIAGCAIGHVVSKGKVVGTVAGGFIASAIYAGISVARGTCGNTNESF